MTVAKSWISSHTYICLTRYIQSGMSWYDGEFPRAPRVPYRPVPLSRSARYPLYEPLYNRWSEHVTPSARAFTGEQSVCRLLHPPYDLALHNFIEMQLQKGVLYFLNEFFLHWNVRNLFRGGKFLKITTKDFRMRASGVFLRSRLKDSKYYLRFYKNLIMMNNYGEN